MKIRRLSRTALVASGVGVLAGAALMAPAAHAAGDGTQYYRYVHVCGPADAGQMRCYAIAKVKAQKGQKGAVALEHTDSLKAQGVEVGPGGGYTPTDLAAAYGVDPNTPTPGQRVAIVDAHDDPNALADLNHFDDQYGLPHETATSFTKVGQDGGAPPTNSVPPTDEEAGWAGEITLDLDAVRGICHTCRILLVEGNTSNGDDLGAAVDTAVRLGATEVSNSYGAPEGSQAGDVHNDETIPALAAEYNHPGVVITASTGDDGYYDYDNMFNPPPAAAGDPSDTSDNAPSTPASYASVVAVTGTTLQLNDDASYSGENVWNLNGQYAITADFAGLGPLGASGGGCSTEFNAPAWQTAVSGWGQTGCGAKRLNGDVAALGDPQTGYDIYDTYQAPGWLTFGGTSLSSPLIAAMWAMAGGSHGVAYPALSLYGNEQSNKGSLHDVTFGGDGLCDGSAVGECQGFWSSVADSPNMIGVGQVDCAWVGETATRNAGTRACDAATGYDGASGVGSPNGLAAFKPLAPSASIKVPKHVELGHKVQFQGTATDPYPGGSITGYSWTATRGHKTSSGSGPTFALKVKKPGKYVVTLKVTDSYGFTGTATVKVKVKAAKHHGGHHHHHHHRSHH